MGWVCKPTKAKAKAREGEAMQVKRGLGLLDQQLRDQGGRGWRSGVFSVQAFQGVSLWRRRQQASERETQRETESERER